MPWVLNLKKVGDGGHTWVHITECPFILRKGWRRREKNGILKTYPSHYSGPNTALRGRNALLRLRHPWTSDCGGVWLRRRAYFGAEFMNVSPQEVLFVHPGNQLKGNSRGRQRQLLSWHLGLIFFFFFSALQNLFRIWKYCNWTFFFFLFCNYDVNWGIKMALGKAGIVCIVNA